MFADRQATAMIPAADLERAVEWYRDMLGLAPAEHHEWGALYRLAGGMRVFVYPTRYAGTAEHTLLMFDTDDLAADMAEMRRRGVAFIDYDLPDLKTVEGVASFGTFKNAWCRDSEGNILGFLESGRTGSA